MPRNICKEKAENIIAICRTSGIQAEPVDLLNWESINVAMARALEECILDEALLDEVYEQVLAPSREELIQEFISSMHLLPENGFSPDYVALVEDLRRIERSGGRGAYEPRTVEGESILLTTAIAIVNNQYQLDKDFIRPFVQNNRLQIAENIRFALEIY